MLPASLPLLCPTLKPLSLASSPFFSSLQQGEALEAQRQRKRVGIIKNSKLKASFRHDIIDGVEQQPDEFYRNNYRRMYDASLRKVADFVGADPQNLAFVHNVTTGINTILKGLEFEKESEVLHTNHTYPSTKFCIDQVRVLPYPVFKREREREGELKADLAQNFGPDAIFN